MNRGITGVYETISTTGGETCRAFIPKPLPPSPPLAFTPAMQDIYERALLAIGGLVNLNIVLPETRSFIYNYVRKEAVLSSQIEGTQSSLDELLLYESSGSRSAPTDDVQEFINYIRAFSFGMKRLRDDGFPLSLRLIREIHGELCARGRGSEKDPGEFRRSQNWIGGSRPGNAVFIPPPPDRVVALMGDLESFLHDRPAPTPPLLKAALAHVQFETIHPFLDGNGRLGRLLIALILVNEKILTEPVLYLSLYFKAHRSDYYALLQSVRQTGNWEEWVEFFLRGVRETSEQAVQTARKLVDLFERDREKIRTRCSRAALSALAVHHELQKEPIVSINSVLERTGLSKPTVYSALRKLSEVGMVSELKSVGKKRAFAYDEYRRILSEGTEPIR